MDQREIPENKQVRNFTLVDFVEHYSKTYRNYYFGGLISIDLSRKIASLCFTLIGHTGTRSYLQSFELHGDLPSEIVRTRRNFVSWNNFDFRLTSPTTAKGSFVCNPIPSTTPSTRKRHDQNTFSVECCRGHLQHFLLELICVG